MAQWHISRDGNQRQPMTLEELLAQLTAGQVIASDLAWTDGMAEWKSVADLPVLAKALPAGADEPAIASTGGWSAPNQPAGVVNYSMPHAGQMMCTAAALESLNRTSPWVRFIAIICFILGGISGLFGVCGTVSMGFASSRGGLGGGEPAGILAIMLLTYGISAAVFITLGVYLNRFASSIRRLVTYRREDSLEDAMLLQRKFWRLLGVVVAVVIGIYVVVIAGFFLLFFNR